LKNIGGRSAWAARGGAPVCASALEAKQNAIQAPPIVNRLVITLLRS
jgi:hypothetical protein